MPACIALLLAIASLLFAQSTPDRVDFNRDVHPILAAKCFGCHGGDKRSGGLSLSNYSEILRGGRTGKVVSPGSAAESLLIQRVQGEKMPAMPLGGEPLS